MFSNHKDRDLYLTCKTLLVVIKHKLSINMKVSTDDIRMIRPGTIEPFLCDDAQAMYSAASLIARLKNVGMPEGIVDYETQKFFGKNIILIHAMKEGDEKVLNR